MYVPEFSEFERLAPRGNLIPVYREILADLETPVSAFLKIDQGGDAFLLESVEGGEKWGRYSFLGVEPRRVFLSRGNRVIEIAEGEERVREVRDPFTAARELLAGFRAVPLPGLPRFSGGLVGYVAYDMARFFERLPAQAVDDLGVPEQYFQLADTLVVFDSTAHKIKVLTHAHVDGGRSLRAAYSAACERIESWIERLQRPLLVPHRAGAQGELQVRSNFQREEYEERVRCAQEYIAAGDVIQVVLAQRFECPLRADPRNIYRALRTVNPSPYMFFLRCGSQTLVGSSPEGREVTVRPIAGTRPRGRDEREDLELERELLADPKELAEHIMLLDLGRNDVGRVAEIGSVRVTERLTVERYSHVMHLVSNVTGTLAAGRDCFDVFRAIFPAGTLTGAPKIRAMEIIEELEPVRRSVYGGAVGYFAFSGNMDTCIAIRTLVIKDGTIYAGAGAGIVADSDPNREYGECVNKARAVFQAVRLAETM